MTLKKFHEQEQKLENYLNQIGIISDLSINKKNLISQTENIELNSTKIINTKTLKTYRL